MCRSIHTLHNFEPAASDDEVQAAALQYVRKIAGSRSPSRAHQRAYDDAVAAITDASRELLAALVTTAAPRTREQPAAQARERGARRAG